MAKRISSGSKNVPRAQEEMIEALRKQVRLLNEYAQKVFVEGNNDYVGEIASKLRILVTKFRSNEPLLLRLMQETKIQPRVILGGPPIQLTPSGPRGGDKITLEEYLSLDAIGIRVPSGEFVTINKIDFIRALAEQAGGAHEDWEMDEALSTVLSAPINIMGLQGGLAELRVNVDTILSVAKSFLEQFDAHSSK